MKPSLCISYVTVYSEVINKPTLYKFGKTKCILSHCTQDNKLHEVTYSYTEKW